MDEPSSESSSSFDDGEADRTRHVLTLRRSIRFAAAVSGLAIMAAAVLAVLALSARVWPLAVLMLALPVGLYVYPTFMEVSLLQAVRMSGWATVTCRGQRLAPGRWWAGRVWQGAAAVAIAVDPGTATLEVFERSRRYRVDLRGLEAVVAHGFMVTGVLLVPVDTAGDRTPEAPDVLAYLLHGRRQRELIDQLRASC